MVSAMHPDAALAGIGILRAGGNAVDAAIAVGAAISVTAPNWAGIGGDSVWLIYRAKTGDLHVIDGYGRCPGALTPDFLADHFELTEAVSLQAFREEPAGFRDRGVVTSTVPGTPAAWAAALASFGSRPMPELLAPAIALADDGFPIPDYLARSIRKAAERIGSFPDTLAAFSDPKGNLLSAGQTLRQAELAETLRRYAHDPENEFRTGRTAQSIVSYAEKAGACLTSDDLGDYRAEWRDAVAGRYRGFPVWTTPPPTAGMHVLQALQILEAFDLASLGFHSPEALHLMIEANKQALADRRRIAGDPDHDDLDVGALLDPAHTTRQATAIRPGQATTLIENSFSPGAETTHLVVADADGNIVSATQTIGQNFGCGEMVPETGIVMNDRTWWMSLGAGPNRVGPFRRANIGHAPTMVFAGDRPWLALGSPGGFGIVQYVVQVLSHVIDFGLDIQAAIEAPRFRLRDLARHVGMEDRFAPETLEALRGYGHEIETLDPWTDRVGGVAAITRDPDNGNLLGGYDPRRNAMALGL
jgi:gamma-glutamyltranspeptidase/glutathione hydrolase